ncbi:MAG: type II secretion system F family protein [Anaerolineales bacterium]|nr:type II secretion system F family protein [Anaerolineales bacterium]
MIVWIVLGLIVLAGAIVLILVGRRTVEEEDEIDPLESRLAEFSARGEIVSLEEIELSQPFAERVLIPFIRKAGEISAKFTPQKVLQQTTRQLELAGNPGRIDAATFLATRFVVAFVFDGFLTLFYFISKFKFSQFLLFLLIFSVVGFFFPQLWLRSKINRRQQEIRKAMPDALDLLTICVEAGLGFDAAMSKVSEKWENELSLAFARAIREVQLGKVRREALKDMADRIDLPELTSFVAAVIQSESLGVSMAKVLRIQSEQMRMKRRQFAEEKAHRAPTIMIIPMGLLIFPSIMIILLTPAALRLVDAFGPLMSGG